MAIMSEAAQQPAQSPVVMSDSSGSPSAGTEPAAANEDSGTLLTTLPRRYTFFLVILDC